MTSESHLRRDFTPWDDPEIAPIISIANVTKKFGAYAAVKNLSLNIYRGEFFGLLGGSGCGKSTLLRMLAGFEETTEGTILIDGQDMRGIPAYRRPVNMMFQSYALFPHMTVHKNIEFGLKQDGMPRAEINQRVEEMLSLVKLEKFVNRKPHQLSGGQRQRVALARAVAKHPKVLLLDEPLGALDKKLREETQFELIDLQSKLGLTFVVVTHDQEEAMTMSHRIAVMDHGEVRQVGSPSEVYEAPSNRFVADFLGNVNIMESKVLRTEAGRAEVKTQDGLRFSAPVGKALSSGATAYYVIRPEKVFISTEAPAAGGMVTANGEVWDIAYLGGITHYHVKLENGTIIRSTAINSERMSAQPFKWRDRVAVSFVADAGILIDQ